MTLFVTPADIFGFGLIALFIVGLGALFALAWIIDLWNQLKRWWRNQ